MRPDLHGWFALASLGLLASILPLQAQDFTGIPTGQFAGEVQKQFLLLANGDSELTELLNQAIVKSLAKSPSDFFSSIRLCSAGMTQSAETSRLKQRKVYFLSRELEEPKTPSDEKAQIEALKPFYRARLESLIPPEINPDSLLWTVEPDVIITSDQQDDRKICIKAGIDPESSATLLAHELIHYIRTPEGLATPDVLQFKDMREYAAYSVLQPGDEVDAYLYEIALRIKHHGRASLGIHLPAAALFNDRGELIGKTSELATHILDGLGYYQNRFFHEYGRVVESQLQEEMQSLHFYAELLKNREQQETSLSDLKSRRMGVANFLSSTYKAETLKIEALLLATRQSRARLVAKTAEFRTRIEKLRARRPSKSNGSV